MALSKITQSKGCTFRQVFNKYNDIAVNKGTVTGTLDVSKGTANFTNLQKITYAPNVGNFGTKDFTCRVVCKLGEYVNVGSALNAILCKGNFDVTGFGITILDDNTLAVKMNNVYSERTTRGYNDTLFHDILFTRVGNNVKLYIDGSIVINSVKTAFASTVNSDGFIIGGHSNTIRYINANIKLVELYNYALSDPEIKNLYTGKTFKQLPLSSNEVLYPDLVLNGNFEQGSGNTFTNWSPTALGSSTITEDSTGGISGSRCPKLFCDSGNSATTLLQSTLTIGKLYKVSLYARATGGTWQIGDNSTGVTITPTSSFALYTAYIFTASTNLAIKRLSAVNQTCWIDQVTCQEVSQLSYSTLLDFDATQGFIQDRSLFKRTLTPTPGLGGIKQANNIKAYLFDGADTKIDCGTFSLLGDITLSCWVKLYGWGEGNLGRIIDGNTYRLIVSIAQLGFVRDGSVSTVSSASNSLKLGSWIHILNTSTSTGITNFYINGVLSGTANQSAGTPSANSNIFIGNNSAGTRTFNGLIAKLNIKQGILSQEQISQTFSSERNIFGV